MIVLPTATDDSDKNPGSLPSLRHQQLLPHVDERRTPRSEISQELHLGACMSIQTLEVRFRWERLRDWSSEERSAAPPS